MSDTNNKTCLHVSIIVGVSVFLAYTFLYTLQDKLIY